MGSRPTYHSKPGPSRGSWTYCCLIRPVMRKHIIGPWLFHYFCWTKLMMAVNILSWHNHHTQWWYCRIMDALALKFVSHPLPPSPSPPPIESGLIQGMQRCLSFVLETTCCAMQLDCNGEKKMPFWGRGGGGTPIASCTIIRLLP